MVHCSSGAVVVVVVYGGVNEGIVEAVVVSNEQSRSSRRTMQPQVLKYDQDTLRDTSPSRESRKEKGRNSQREVVRIVVVKPDDLAALRPMKARDV